MVTSKMHPSPTRSSAPGSACARVEGVARSHTHKTHPASSQGNQAAVQRQASLLLIIAILFGQRWHQESLWRWATHCQCGTRRNDHTRGEDHGARLRCRHGRP